MRNLLTLIVSGLLIISLFESCKQSNAFSGNNAEEPEVSVPGERLETLGVLYMQTAAEYRALCYQAYNLAELRLNQLVDQHSSGKPMAVILDIDETVLDNSPFEAKGILEDTHYPEGWSQWVNLATAESIAGALEFTKLAQRKSVQIYYITNRDNKYRKETLRNLRDLQFPFADNDHLFMKTDETSKKARRELILQRSEVLLLIGDNLADFSEVFEQETVNERMKLVDRFKDKFGSMYIVLPNPVYGNWVNAIYGGDRMMTPEQKATMRKEALKPF